MKNEPLSLEVMKLKAYDRATGYYSPFHPSVGLGVNVCIGVMPDAEEDTVWLLPQWIKGNSRMYGESATNPFNQEKVTDSMRFWYGRLENIWVYCKRVQYCPAFLMFAEYGEDTD